MGFRGRRLKIENRGTYGVYFGKNKADCNCTYEPCPRKSPEKQRTPGLLF